MLILLEDGMRWRGTEQKTMRIALYLWIWLQPSSLVSYKRQASSCFTGRLTFWFCWPTNRPWALFFFYASMAMQVTNFKIEMYSCNYHYLPRYLYCCTYICAKKKEHFLWFLLCHVGLFIKAVLLYLRWWKQRGRGLMSKYRCVNIKISDWDGLCIHTNSHK